MNLPRPIVLGTVIFLQVVFGSNVFGYGPGTHLREGFEYIDGLEQGFEPIESARDLDLLQNPDYTPYFLIGTSFPDIGRQIDGIGFEPHRLDWLSYMLESTQDWQPGEESMRAFALGNALHGAGDMSAQVFLVPVLTAATGIGFVDVLVDVQDTAGQENEFFVEGLGDLRIGDLHGVIDLYVQLMVADNAPPLYPIFVEYYELAHTYYDLSLTPDEFATRGMGFVNRIEGYLGGMSPEFAHSLVDMLINAEAAQYIDLAMQYGSELFGTQEIDFDPANIDRFERDRLEQHPFFYDAATFDIYNAYYHHLGPAFLRDYFAENIAFREWTTWHTPALAASGIQSLAWHVPETHYPESALLFWSIQFKDSSGNRLDTVDLLNLPDEVIADIVVFPAKDEDCSLRVQVKADRPGFNTSEDPLLAEATLFVEGLPGFGAPPHRDQLQISFQPGLYLDDILGYYLVFFNDSRTEALEKPFLTTIRDPYVSIDVMDITLPVWNSAFSGVGGWQPFLPISSLSLRQESGTLELKVRNGRYPRKGVEGALVVVDGVNFSQEVNPNRVGWAVFEDLPAGQYVITSAEAEGYSDLNEEVAVEVIPGQPVSVSVFLEPFVAVEDFGEFAPDRDFIKIKLPDQERFPLAQEFELAASATEVPPETDWIVTSMRGAEIPLEPEASDGEIRYAFARSRISEEEHGPISVTDGIIIDGSPPQLSPLEAEYIWPEEVRELAIPVSSEDPHSGVVLYQAIIFSTTMEPIELEFSGDMEYILIASDDLSMEGDEFELLLTALNGSGLESEQVRTRVVVLKAELAEDFLESPDDGADVSVEELLADSSKPGEDCSCSIHRQQSFGRWWYILLVILGCCFRKRTRKSSIGG